MAKVIPGKEEFYETLRYFSKKLEIAGVDIQLNTKVDSSDLLAADPAYDAVILATGVLPRKINFEGSDHPKVSVFNGHGMKHGDERDVHPSYNTCCTS